MDSSKFLNVWRDCLGRELSGGVLCLPDNGPNGLGFNEILLEFCPPIQVLIGWQQWEDIQTSSIGFDLHVDLGVNYDKLDFDFCRAEESTLLSGALGRTHTRLELFGDSVDSRVYAAKLHFGSHCIVVATGEPLIDNGSERLAFGTDATIVCTPHEFETANATAKNPLVRLSRCNLEQ